MDTRYENPSDRPEKKKQPPDAAVSFSRQIERCVFLIVDDFDSMRRITINQLRQLGAKHIHEAANGAEAAKILAYEPITLVLSDWNMPVMSGLELLSSIRSDPKHYALPFIMITAEAERDRVQQAINAGVSELLVKPYTAARFAERLERALTRKVTRKAPGSQGKGQSTNADMDPGAAPDSPAEAKAPAANEKPTILVVDDMPDNLHLLTQLFKNEYRVKIAHNGEKALSICHSDAPPDLVLLDVMMPGIDGFEVAEKLRSHPSSEHIPIIFVTALADETSRHRGIELGAVDFVTKPIDPDTLRMRVKNFMRYVNLHRQLQTDYDNMLEIARLKEDVEHITRHDIKGPLAGVVSLAQNLVETSNLRSEQCDQLRMIEDAALQVMDMINLSAEIYKIETGRFRLNPQPVPLVQIIRRLVATADRTFSVKGLELSVMIPEKMKDADLVVSGDPMFCHSLFHNLLKNACEAAPDRTTVIIAIGKDISLTTRIENKGTVPALMRDRFFEKFATAGKTGGTGLGTYSAKLLVEAQGGRIEMHTDDDKNLTAITVALPAGSP